MKQQTNTPVQPTTVGEPKFYYQDLDDEQNIPDLQRAITEWPMVGIVDETKGIVAYAAKENAEEIIRKCNAFPAMLEALKRCRDWFWLNAKELKIPLEGVGSPVCFEEIEAAIQSATK